MPFRNIPYATLHQAISMLNGGLIFVSARHWIGASPIVGEVFQLNGTSSDNLIPQPSLWKIISTPAELPPSIVTSEFAHNLRRLWPFKDNWIMAGDTVYNFVAKPVSPINRAALSAWVEGEKAKHGFNL